MNRVNGTLVPPSVGGGGSGPDPLPPQKPPYDPLQNPDGSYVNPSLGLGSTAEWWKLALAAVIVAAIIGGVGKVNPRAAWALAFIILLGIAAANPTKFDSLLRGRF